ncbi:hypothetical protein D0T49_06055, partial [Paludibacter sp. 221]|uniref:cadherin-like beta sandwich domain-containing protein n=1 Tax=Paludibacter sp. 221 TaxID=2302939 RepID=UPI0013D4E62C
NQLWKVTGTVDNYILTSKDGLNIKLVSSAFQATAGEGDVFEFLPIYSGSYAGSLAIKRKATTAKNAFNPTGGSNIGNPIGEYYLYDGGCAIKFVKLLSSDATLSALTVSVGDLDPVFDAATDTYSVSVDNSVTSIDITATATDAEAEVVGDGTKDLKVGENPFEITVTAEDGTTQTYTVTVTRASGGTGLNDATADINISIANGTLTVEFEGAKAVKLYSVSGLLVDDATVVDTYTKALQQGIYMLTVDNVTYKVFVK